MKMSHRRMNDLMPQCDSKLSCAFRVGIRVVCARFHHRGDIVMKLSRNLTTRFRIDPSFPREQNDTHLEGCIFRGDLCETDYVAEVDGHCLVILGRHLLKEKKLQIVKNEDVTETTGRKSLFPRYFAQSIIYDTEKVRINDKFKLKENQMLQFKRIKEFSRNS